MPVPWKERVLASYWIPAVGIGNPLQWVKVPLTDVGKYVLAGGKPQTNVVFLGFASFTGSPSSFNPPYISIPGDLLEQMTLQPGQKQTNVQYLQSLGIKVLLSIQGYTPQGQPSGMGWDGVPAGKNQNFADWVKTQIIDKYRLDGIDIDNEWSGLPSNPQNFVNTVSALRRSLPNGLISKALWQDFNYFTVPVSGGLPGIYLANLLDLGGTMSYGSGYQSQIDLVNQYLQIQAGGQNVGLKRNQICIGVQAGPPDQGWMTPIAEVAQLAKWVVQPPQAILGMMLFTFSQDIQQFTYSPQNDPKHKFPNPNDHEWQKAIIQGMWSPGDWLVK
jgi:hypothetical protein